MHVCSSKREENNKYRFYSRRQSYNKIYRYVFFQGDKRRMTKRRLLSRRKAYVEKTNSSKKRSYDKNACIVHSEWQNTYIFFVKLVRRVKKNNKCSSRRKRSDGKLCILQGEWQRFFREEGDKIHVFFINFLQHHVCLHNCITEWEVVAQTFNRTLEKRNTRTHINPKSITWSA